MSPDPHLNVVGALENSRRALREALAGIPEREATRIPAAGRWSVAGIVEHVVIAEIALLAGLKAAPADENLASDSHRDAALAAQVAGRATRLEAPERTHPTGRFGSMAQTLSRFEAARADTIQCRAAWRGSSFHRRRPPFFRQGEWV